MQSKNWEKVKPILDKVLELDSDERQSFLVGLEIEIRTEIETLLAFEETADNWSPTTALELSKDFFEDEDAKNRLIGQRIGVYEISEEIGFGGMGAVYLAHRVDDKFQQKVAIKMLRREFNTEKIRKRFRQEREIQAALVHPNIASLIDAGTTDDGVPYLVMEYVEGERIDLFCAENDLKLNERLKLFNKVCEAVSFAHRNLIIHRDIKPSNIIVTKKGEPKLLDFGISKLIDKNNSTTKTITKLGAMTPEYASPEQVRGESVTTATDIYSLGVILFKILTDTMPLEDVDTGRQGDGEIKEPSSKIPSSPHLPVSSSQLKGDLDNIILKSLRKEPERRYNSVEQFAADIWRFMDGLPVTARPSTFSYRASKFYGRNKIQVLAGVFVFLSLITGIAVAFWQADAARKLASIAAEAQKKAEIESAKSKEEEERAKKITQFMEKIIAYANPAPYAEGHKQHGDAKIIEVLEEMSDKIETDFPNRADIQAELHHKFAEIYTQRATHNYGESPDDEVEKGMYHAGRAIELRKQYYGERHELIAKDMFYLWAINEDKSNAGLLAEAIQMMRETNRNNLNLPYMLQSYAIFLSFDDTKEFHELYYKNSIPKPSVGRLELAENYYIEALPLFRAAYPEEHTTMLNYKCDLSFIQIERGKFIEAQKNFPFCRQYEKFYKTSKTTELKNKYAERLEKGLQN